MKKLLVLSALVLLTACGQTTTEKIVEKAKSREIFTLKSEKTAPVLELTGNIEAEKQVPISSKIMGRIDSLKVDVGDKVYKGQILARYSAVDSDTLAQYQSALSQLKATEATTKNAINTAQVQLESAERALRQTKKETEVQRKKQYKNLATNAKLSEITISNILDFLDKNLEATDRFKGMNAYKNIIGRNNSILKNNLKNSVEEKYQIFAGFSQNVPKSETAILDFAEKRLDLLKKIKKDLSDFDNLIRRTTVSSSFPETVKNGFLGKIASYQKNISETITNLQNFITGTKVMNEQLSLKVLAVENQVKTAKSGVELAKSNAENQVVAAKSQVNIAGTYQREMVVKAPFNGTIISRKIDVGQLVAPGQTLFEIADMSGFKVRTDVADIYAGLVSLEMPVEIAVDGLKEKFAGTVTKVNPALDPRTRKLGIEITFVKDKENKEIFEKLKIGLFARIKMQLPERKIFKIPRNFIKFDYDGAKILLDNQKWQKVDILSDEGNIVGIYFDEITDGLKIMKP